MARRGNESAAADMRWETASRTSPRPMRNPRETIPRAKAMGTRSARSRKKQAKSSKITMRDRRRYGP
jgi:hypothetical protein